MVDQRELPILARHYHYFAEAAAKHPIPLGRMAVTDITKQDNGLVRWEDAEPSQQPLPGLLLLRKLAEIGSYIANEKATTRRNVITAARIGSFALRHTYSLAEHKRVRLSRTAISGIRETVAAVHGNIDDAFRQVSSNDSRDFEAFYFLSEAARLLRQQR